MAIQNQEGRKKKTLSREDATELYRDLHKTMSKMKGEKEAPKKGPLDNKLAKQLAEAIRSSMRKDDAMGAQEGQPAADLGPDLSANIPPEARAAVSSGPRSFTPVPGYGQGSGSQLAITIVVFFLLTKVTFSALEFSGVFGVELANATLAPAMKMQRAPFSTPKYTEAEVTVLKQLDAQRVKLEERGDRLSAKERELELKEQEFVARMTEIRDLTEKLKATRGKNKAKRNSQLEQLSNVYGSMNPNEAAQLIEQLDVTIALSLLERMPEKRIGQILSLMSPERALTITRMLSNRERVR